VVQLPKLNTKLSEEGRWVDFPDAPGISVLIARAGNRAARDMMMKLGQRSVARIRAGSRDAVESLNRKVMAHCIIRDWKGLTDEQDKEIPYSPEMALEIIGDPRYALFYEWVQSESGLDDEYLKEGIEEAVGNLRTSSAGG
jgi:hypothetical protein